MEKTKREFRKKHSITPQKATWQKWCGVTLVEMLLVMVIITSIIVVAGRYMQQQVENARIDRTVLQMDYILNAGLSYYVANGRWPGEVGQWYGTLGTPLPGVDPSPLQPDYLPAQTIANPWGLEGFYWHIHNDVTYSNIPANTFSVWVYMGTSSKQQTLSNILAGKFPFAYVTQAGDEFPGYVVAYVNIPTQDLNNAMAVNFAGLYHHGACVPVPTCPTTAAGAGTNMTPQVFVVPVSVSGVNDPGTSGGNVYPISSFTAFSTAMSAAPGATPPACPGGAQDACAPIEGPAPQTDRYWRVCLQVVTERGNVQDTRADEWGDRVTLGAFTRCGITNEPAGSTFSVFTH